ncbi:MAG TPA: CVNH domain-containing protein [Ktedonobacteraceae bacterium]|nr:CVNH domain-containing protein [Ktedonobacteraceae bacterium]
MIKRILFAFVGLLMVALFLFPSSNAFAASSQVTVPQNHFGDTCSHESINKQGVLSAWCTRKNGTTNKNAVLGLDAFIGDVNGFLTSNKSFFVENCPSFHLSGITLVASCRTAGHTVSSTCNLNENVDNNNGALRWESGHPC